MASIRREAASATTRMTSSRFIRPSIGLYPPPLSACTPASAVKERRAAGRAGLPRRRSQLGRLRGGWRQRLRLGPETTMSETVLHVCRQPAPGCASLRERRILGLGGDGRRKRAGTRRLRQVRASKCGGSDGTRTRDLRLDRPALPSRKCWAVGELRQPPEATMSQTVLFPVRVFALYCTFGGGGGVDRATPLR